MAPVIALMGGGILYRGRMGRVRMPGIILGDTECQAEQVWLDTWGRQWGKTAESRECGVRKEKVILLNVQDGVSHGREA